RFRFYPKQSKIFQHGPELYASWYWDNDNWNSLERQSRVGYSFVFLNRSEINFRGEEWFVFLRQPFDPTRTGATPLADSVGYNWRLFSASYKSDFRKKLNFELGANYGSYYSGQRGSVSGSLNYRLQPLGIFSLTLDYNRISLPDTTVGLLLISPRMEFSFTRSLFFTTFFQFNTQTQNFGVNARLQWRFKPMSDLFLVVTDNYFTENFGVRNRAVVLKLNYWLTL
ncbi:MAG: hypothetical protein AAF570_25345, partial [Bacteroidota bacterium]